jgi:hypothetical protein
MGYARLIADDNINTDYVPGLGHPGVIKAVYVAFKDNYTIVPGSCVWWSVK